MTRVLPAAGLAVFFAVGPLAGAAFAGPLGTHVAPQIVIDPASVLARKGSPRSYADRIARLGSIMGPELEPAPSRVPTRPSHLGLRRQVEAQAR